MWRFTYQASQKRLQPKTACSFTYGLIDCAERSDNCLVFDHHEPAAVLRQQQLQIVSEVLSFDIQHLKQCTTVCRYEHESHEWNELGGRLPEQRKTLRPRQGHRRGSRVGCLVGLRRQ